MFSKGRHDQRRDLLRTLLVNAMKWKKCRIGQSWRYNTKKRYSYAVFVSHLSLLVCRLMNWMRERKQASPKIGSKEKVKQIVGCSFLPSYWPLKSWRSCNVRCDHWLPLSDTFFFHSVRHLGILFNTMRYRYDILAWEITFFFRNLFLDNLFLGIFLTTII